MFQIGDMIRHVNEHVYGFIIDRVGTDSVRYRVQWFESEDKYLSNHRWFYHREIEKVEE
jgi:hypothetical protein